jgi:hypothetical protein
MSRSADAQDRRARRRRKSSIFTFNDEVQRRRLPRDV